MVSPERRRDAVGYLCRRHRISERRACRLVGQHRSTNRYQPAESGLNEKLVVRMNELAAKNPRYGYRRIWAMLRTEGFEVNRKRVERLWRLEGHKVPAPKKPHGKKAVGGAEGAPWNLPASAPNDVWSIDFVQTRTRNGGSIRILNVVDEHTRRALGAKVAPSIGASQVARFLEGLFEVHGRPKIIRSDNGREFIAGSLAALLAELGIRQAFIEPGKPQQNPYVERFNGAMRDELLNGETFHTVAEAKVMVERYLYTYNHLRPHRGLKMKTPQAFFDATRVVSK